MGRGRDENLIECHGLGAGLMEYHEDRLDGREAGLIKQVKAAARSVATNF